MNSTSQLDRREFIKTIAVGAGLAAAGMAAFAKALNVVEPSRQKGHFSPQDKCSLARTNYCKSCRKCLSSPQEITPPGV